jgi:ankyrin repeat protein
LSGISSRESVTIEKETLNPPEGKWVSALQIAVKRGHLRIVRVLLQQGVDCNQKDGEGLTLLIHSIISDHEDVLSSLIQSGARICETDDKQRNAIHWAVSQRREALLEVLLKHCSGDQTLIESHDLRGRTPLHTAVNIGFEAGVRILLEAGASPNCWATDY